METRDAIIEAAEQALDAHDPAAAEARVAAYRRAHPGDSGIAHWLALLWREQDRREEAIPLLRSAVAVARDDADLRYALAQILSEAGRPAVAEFEAAVLLAPGRADVRLGLTGARLAAGDGERAIDELGGLLAQSPGWLEGHQQYVQVAAQVGRRESALESLERAIAAHPLSAPLHRTVVQILLDADLPAQARHAARRGLRAIGADFALMLGEAAATDELGELATARTLFERLGTSPDHAVLVRRARHLLRSGEAGRVANELDPHLSDGGSPGLWPYAALAWRAIGDSRAAWLEDRAELVSVTDLDPEVLQFDRLQGVLERLHERSGRFLDQSVRGGTQTPGALFARIEPEIARLRAVVRSEVVRHIAGFAADDVAHPTLSRRRGNAFRFAGSWSVRLNDAGFHQAHHHPQGWLSSALYIAVPENASGAGTLELGGSPPNLGMKLAPRLTVEPKAGRLVLFPSWMWHATRPFDHGVRLTVAFDVASI